MKKFAILGLLVLAFTGFAFASHDPDDTLVVKAKISAVFDVVVTDALYEPPLLNCSRPATPIRPSAH